MGLSASHAEYYVYARDRVTDQYRDTPLLTVQPTGGGGVGSGGNLTTPPVDERALGIFKREVYAMATGYDHQDVKALYLYGGRWRLVRAEQTTPRQLRLRFASAEVRDAFTAAEELLANDHRWPMRGPAFRRRYTRRREEDTASTVQEADREDDTVGPAPNLLEVWYDDTTPVAAVTDPTAV